MMMNMKEMMLRSNLMDLGKGAFIMAGKKETTALTIETD